MSTIKTKQTPKEHNYIIPKAANIPCTIPRKQHKNKIVRKQHIRKRDTNGVANK